MKNLLRSCFLAQPTDSEAQFAQNYHAMVESGLGFDTPEDNVVWTYIQDFFKTYGHVPTIQTMRSHFTSVQETDVVDRIERLAMIKPRTRGDFLTHLEEKAKDRRNRVALELFKEGAKIISSGVEIKDHRGNTTKLLGAIDAIRYVLDGSHGLVAPTLGSKLSGNLTQDGEDFKSRYERVKADPKFGIGQYCGVAQIDAALQGAKRYELWVHAGFTGSMKSSFALHWAYIQAVYFGFSSVYFSLEMPYIQCRNIIYTMHTAHEDFAEIREQLGISGRGLEYEKIRDGRLEPHEEKFLFEYVVPDLGGRSTVPHDDPGSLKAEEYGSIHLEVADPDKTDFTMADLRSRSELIFSKTPFSMIFVDHAGLMSARGRYSSTTDKLNEVIRDLKRLAMSFNRGMGIAVVCLFQISREGYRSAEKNGGRYNLTHLSYANECLVRGTSILTDEGLLPIETVKPGMRVWSRSGWKPVLDFFDQGVRPVWRLTNDRGEQIEATANHRLRVLRDEKIQWSRVDELQEGDWLVGTEGDYPWNSESPPLPALEVGPYEKPSGEQGVPLRVPSCLDDGLAYLLGAWDGDGRTHPQGVGFTGNRDEEAVRDNIRSAFHATFGHEIGLQESPSRPGSFDLLKWSQPLKRWLEGVSGPRGEKVPDVVLRAPRHLVLAYMKGLWDTDGWVNNQGVVGLKMKSEAFLREVQLLMTALGIDTVLESNETTLEKTGKTYPGWTLRVRGTESKRRFQSGVGFSEPRKAKMLEDTFAETPKDKRTYPIGRTFAAVASDYTPYSMITSGRLKKSHYNAVRRARIDGAVSHGAIETLLRVMEEDGAVEDPRVGVLREVLSRRITRVSRIEPDVREEHVFDIEVDGDHEFQSGAFLSHNCERSADIVTATWIDDELRKIDKAIFQCLKSRDQAPFERVPVRVEFPWRRLLTDDTPMSEVDAEVQAAKGAQGGEDDDQKKWRKKAKRDQETPDLGF
jgi:hypothetical protein